ncbi:MAG: hypothetical protein GWO41_00910 [candidate division Zixibacteria bacterium]|nr:hypothetical protein [candidate division Zixibacteria bacterium]NIR63779.1 hypothetical protein [candidate division Zixibacteria bacterium]NIS45738.1 hypothetical protein [candidate division Zixibacteria bacterium]NIT51341.1 hypothetical protein [candidate division Zixibacteria bacterium]NIU13860.1 hypothetical protein [candidate division Zixibacteria bacterium]
MSKLELRPLAFEHAYGRSSRNESEHLRWIRGQRGKCHIELGVKRCSEDEFDGFLIKNMMNEGDNNETTSY